MKRTLTISLCVVVLATTLHEVSAGMSMAQIKNTMKMVRNACMPKTGVSLELVDNVQNGGFPDDSNLKCYMKCVLTMMQSRRHVEHPYELIFKGNKYKPDAAIAQVKALLTDDLKDKVIASMETCRNAADGIDDGCEAAYTTVKCLYEADSENFFFP